MANIIIASSCPPPPESLQKEIARLRRENLRLRRNIAWVIQNTRLTQKPTLDHLAGKICMIHKILSNTLKNKPQKSS